MKLKNTVVLLLLAIIVGGGYYYLNNVKKLQTTEQAEAKRKRLFDFQSADVSELRVKGPDRNFIFERQNGKWNLKAPIQVRANGGEINEILSKVEYLEHKRILTPKEVAEYKLTLADYGLDQPKTVAEVKTKNQSYSIKLGNERRQGNDQFIQIDGDPNIYVVDKQLGVELSKKIEDYRERLLFDNSLPDINHFEIKNGVKVFEFAKTNGSWKVVQPLYARADAEKVNDFLRETCDLRAEDFLSEDPATAKQYGLDEPYNSTVKLDTPSASSILILGGRVKSDEPKIAAKIKGQNSIVSIQETYSNSFNRPLNDFRDRHVVTVNPEEIQDIELHSRQLTIALQKQNNVWKFTQPQGAPEVDQDLVKEFLARLNAIQIKEFVTDVPTDLEKYSLKTPIASIVLKSQAAPNQTNDTSTVKMNLGFGGEDAAKKLTFVKLADESSVYGLDQKDSAALPKGINDLRSRKIFEIKKEQIKSATQKKGKTAFTITKTSEGTWQLGENSQGVLNETPWQKFLNHMERFTVERIVGTAVNGSLKQYGLDNPIATITIETEVDGKPVTQELVLGKDTGKGVYMIWKNELLICQISPQSYKNLGTDWVIKQLPEPSTPPPAAAESKKSESKPKQGD